MSKVVLVATVPQLGDDALITLPSTRIKLDGSMTFGALNQYVLEYAASVADSVDLSAELVCIGPGFLTYGPERYTWSVGALFPSEDEPALKLFFSPIWRQFTLSSPSHRVMYLAQPFKGCHFLIDPPTMGVRFLEEIAEWLSGPRVAAYLAWSYNPSMGKSGAKFQIAQKLQKLARSFAIMGGPNGFLLARFTVEFAADHSAVRNALRTIKDEIDENPSEYPVHDFDSSKLLLSEPTTMASVEGAMVQCLRLLHHKFELRGTPFLISSEFSGNGSKGVWVDGERNVHGTLNWILDPDHFTDPSKNMIHLEAKQYASELGLVAKQCGDDAETIPGFKIEFNYPFMSVLRWQYELKTPFGRELCCIIKELFGAGNRLGFMCAVRQWKAKLHIPCGKYPTIAMLRVGGFKEHIADRTLPEGLVDWRLLSEKELTDVGRKIQYPLSKFAIADTQAETQPDASSAIVGVSEAAAQVAVAEVSSAGEGSPESPSSCLTSLVQCLQDSGLSLSSVQLDACAHLGKEVDEMNGDNFDVTPQPVVDEAEQELEAAGTDPEKLKALAKKLILLAGKRSRDGNDIDGHE